MTETYKRMLNSDGRLPNAFIDYRAEGRSGLVADIAERVIALAYQNLPNETSVTEARPASLDTTGILEYAGIFSLAYEAEVPSAQSVVFN